MVNARIAVKQERSLYETDVQRDSPLNKTQAYLSKRHEANAHFRNHSSIDYYFQNVKGKSRATFFEAQRNSGD
jgi:hypothetical protein